MGGDRATAYREIAKMEIKLGSIEKKTLKSTKTTAEIK